MKSFATDLTDPWLETGVDANMCVEGGTPVETFPTFTTSVRLFLRMDDFVPAQRARLPES